MVEFIDVFFSYPGISVLRGATLYARDGECVVISGDNGCGKSTLISVAAGILKPESGSVRLSGKAGFAPQETALLEDMSVKDNIRFFSRLAGVKPPKQLPFGIEAFARKKVSALSGGMKKRVSLACAMLGMPPVLLLDEPAASLDTEYQAELRETVRMMCAAGCTVLYISHDESEYRDLPHRLYYLSDGALSECAVTNTPTQGDIS